MKASTRRRVVRTLGAAGLAAATLFTMSSLAQAEPGRAAVIEACVDKWTGDVRIPGTKKDNDCAKNEKSLAWNIKGPRGPRGPEGEAELPPVFEANNVGTLVQDPTTTVVSLTGLPAGRYHATATLTANTIGPAPLPRFLCYLQLVGTDSSAFMAQTPRGEPVTAQTTHTSGSMTGLVTVGANGTINVSCFGGGNFQAKLVALAVAPAAQ